MGEPPTTAISPLLTAGEVAGILRKPERTLREWRKLRKGPAWIPVMGDIRYSVSDLLRWLVDRRQVTIGAQLEDINGAGLRSEREVWERIEALIQAAVERRLAKEAA